MLLLARRSRIGNYWRCGCPRTTSGWPVPAEDIVLNFFGFCCKTGEVAAQLHTVVYPFWTTSRTCLVLDGLPCQEPTEVARSLMPKNTFLYSAPRKLHNHPRCNLDSFDQWVLFVQQSSINGTKLAQDVNSVINATIIIYQSRWRNTNPGCRSAFWDPWCRKVWVIATAIKSEKIDI